MIEAGQERAQQVMHFHNLHASGEIRKRREQAGPGRAERIFSQPPIDAALPQPAGTTPLRSLETNDIELSTGKRQTLDQRARIEELAVRSWIRIGKREPQATHLPSA
jgi:hypothetical protein